LTTQVSE